MRFGGPWWSLGLLALVPLIAAHLRRRASPPREVGTLLLWRRLRSAAAPASRRFRRPPRPWLLALEAAIVIAAVGSLVAPRTPGGSARAAHVFVVDDSYWLGTSARRAELARVVARDASPAGRNWLIAAGVAPTIVASGSASEVVTAARQLRPAAPRTDLRAGLLQAATLVSARARIEVVRALEDPLPHVLAPAGHLTSVVVGTRLDDRGLVAATPRCGVDTTTGCEILVQLRNDAARPVSVALEAAVAGGRTVRIPARAAAGATTPVALSAPPRARITLRLAGRDAVRVDDVLTVQMPGPGDTPPAADVTVVGDPSRSAALARALRAVPGVALRLRSAADVTGSDVRASDLLVVDAELPADLPTAAATLLVHPARVLGLPARDDHAATAPTSTEDSDPLLDGVDLSSLSLDPGAARRYTLPAFVQPVIRAGDTALLAAGSDGRRKVAVLAFEPSRSDLPQLEALPLLARNLVRWAAGTAPSGAQGADNSPIDLRPALTATVRSGSRDLSRLALALAIVGVCAELALAGRPRRSGLSWRSLQALGALVLGAALVAHHVGHGPPPTVLAVDASASIDASQRALERDWVAHLRPGACARVSCPVATFAAAAQVAPASNLAGAGDARATNLARGISAAADAAAAGGRVVAMTDGAVTGGDLTGAIAAARARRVAVDVVPLADPQLVDAALVRVSAPTAAHIGDAVPLLVTVRSTSPQRARLAVARDGGSYASTNVVLHKGDNPFALSYTAGALGWHSFAVRVVAAGDRVTENDALAAVVHVTAAPRVLVAASGGESTLADRLQASGLTVTRVGPAALPSTAGGLGGFDAVVLDDVPVSALGPSQIAALGGAVRASGVGLLAAGGTHAFSLGGYAGSPLDDLLPVASRQPGELQRRDLALELVVDRSGSMADRVGGVQKIAMAKRAALAAVAFAAGHDDELGAIAFDIAPHVALPLKRLASANRTAANRTLGRVTANGGTDIYRGLRSGLAQIMRSRSTRRHIILLSDGISQPHDYTALLAALRRDHVAVATVALGASADRGLLQRIADETGGNFYATSNARTLPRIFAREARLAAKPARLNGHLRVSAVAASPVTRSLAGKPLPAVAGLAATDAKPTAQVDLRAGPGSTSAPLLAQWQVGAGRVVAWTSSAGAPSAPAWGGDRALWDDAVRWLARPAPRGSIAVTAAAGADGGVRVDTSSLALAVPALRGTIVTPGATRALRLTEVAPATYAAALPSLRPGLAQITVALPGAGRVQSLVAVPYPAEFRPPARAGGVAGQLVALSGGNVLTASARDALDRGGMDVALLLSILGALLYLTGTGVRLLRVR